MATTEDKLIIHQLAKARDHLLARGDAEAVKSLDAIIARLDDEASESAPAPAAPPATKELLTAQEAADLLGIRSASIIHRWAREGILKFKSIDARPMLIRESVEKLVGSQLVRDQRQWEIELDEALAPFDATTEDLAEIYDWYEPPSSRDASD